MLTYLAVALGGGVGGALRYWLSGLVTARVGDSFPWGTLLVNVSGAFLVGMLAVLAGVVPWLDGPAYGLLVIGLCGSYTTVSSFSLQTLALIRQSDWSGAAANILLSLFGCMMALWTGATVVRVLLGGAP